MVGQEELLISCMPHTVMKRLWAPQAGAEALATSCMPHTARRGCGQKRVAGPVHRGTDSGGEGKGSCPVGVQCTMHGLSAPDSGSVCGASEGSASVWVLGRAAGWSRWPTCRASVAFASRARTSVFCHV